ncbi:MAG: aldo/keto reductase [Candidatus Glassbacteria bacterium]
MRYKLLGKSGLRVSEICLGAMTFGQEWEIGAPKKESFGVMETFAKAGGNFIDTADLYQGTTSEKWVGEFAASDRDHWVLATKYSLSMRPDDPNFCGNHRKHLVQAVEASLERLATDYIDLYWVHAWDFLTPVEEVVRGLDDLVRSGKVLYVGVSDTPAWIVSQAVTLAELRGWSRFVGLQIEYSLIERTPERELLPMARTIDLAVTPWGALGGGLLTGKYTGDPKKDKKVDTGRKMAASRRFTERNLTIASTLRKVADESGCKPSQAALAWLRSRPGVIIPVVGARRADQLAESLGCLDLTLSPGQLAALDEVSRIEMGFPMDFLEAAPTRKIRFGDTGGLIDSHRPY